MPAKSYAKNYFIYINILRYWKFITVRLNELLTNFLGTLLDVKPKGIFIAGDWSKKKLENYLKKQNLSKFFINYHLIPMVSAIWSMPPYEARQMPLSFFLKFLKSFNLQ